MNLFFFDDTTKSQFESELANHKILADVLSKKIDNVPVDMSDIIPGVFGVRLRTSDRFDRILSGWIFGRLIDSVGQETAKQVGVWNGKTIDRIDQFTSVTNSNELLCFQSSNGKSQALEQLVLAITSFDRTNFDSDGYIK